MGANMRVWSQIVRVSGTGYFLALMLLSSYMLIFTDRVRFKRKDLKKESRFAFVTGIIYVVTGIILFALRNSSWAR
jgi:uncharacterized membrane protein YiaA